MDFDTSDLPQHNFQHWLHDRREISDTELAAYFQCAELSQAIKDLPLEALRLLLAELMPAQERLDAAAWEITRMDTMDIHIDDTDETVMDYDTTLTQWTK